MFIPLRDENPTRRIPFLTISLIVMNCAIFLYQAFSPQGLSYFILRFGAVPYEIVRLESLAGLERVSPVLSLLTSMFLHGSLFHLAGNMLYLWIFGNNIEDVLGPIRFFLFYLLSGLAAGLVQAVAMPASRAPIIGASGAIAGILGAYWLLFPRARIMTFVFLFIYIGVVPVPAAVILGIWFLAQILNVGLGGGVAWFAHIGGFLAGIGLIWIFRGRRKASAG